MSDKRQSAPSGISIAIAVLAAACVIVLAYLEIGLPPVIIVGGSTVVGLLVWLRCYAAGPVSPDLVLPPFLLTTAGLEIHMFEEYVSGFGPAMSRLFDISWTEFGFLVTFAFVGPAVYSLTALGLFRRVPLAGFVACFIFVGPGVAEFTHFVFPFIKPALQPHDLDLITRTVHNGRVVSAMPNYWLGATGRYYFPGLYTAVLPMIPGIWGLRRMLAAAPGRG